MEKYLKAFLISKGWELQRIHDLEALLNVALQHDPTVETYRSTCQKITGFYLVERYPFISESGLTEEDVRDSLRRVKPLIERLQMQVRK